MGSYCRKAVWLVLAGGSSLTRFAIAQEMPNMSGPGQEHVAHAEMKMPGVTATYPRLGRLQEHPQEKLFTLEEAQQLALGENPTLRQAQAQIRAARARQQQSGLYPNPTVGYSADEIRAGSGNGGKQGFFLEQTIVTGGKLGNSRRVFRSETQLAEIEAEEQKLRVQTAIKTAYLRVLAAQELLDTRSDLAKIEQEYAQTLRQLRNTGQTDETELLAAEISARRQRLGAHIEENALLEQWRSLTAVIGKPDMPLAVVRGQLDQGWPEVSEEQITLKLATDSPASRIAAAAVGRADAEVRRAKRASIPDLELRAGLEYNNAVEGPSSSAIGWEGIAELGLQLPLFNRNQGNVGAAEAESERARLEVRRVQLTLRQRATSVLDEYANARLMAIEYRDELLPRARRAYGLMNEKYGLMLASYPRVIETQRDLYWLQLEYIRALETLWTTGIALEGYLLTDGLEAPANPGEVDRPVREINVPMPESSSPGNLPVTITHP